MARPNQLQDRNVRIFSDKDQSELAGFTLSQPLTRSFVYKMLDILIVPTATVPQVDGPSDDYTGFYSLISQSGETLERDTDLFQAGRYHLNSQYPYSITDEAPLTRLASIQTETRRRAFTEAVYSRDDHCVISGQEIEIGDDGGRYYNGFAAAHIFPLAYESTWISGNYSRWIAKVPETGDSINSVQNGLLLNASVYQLFDTYELTIDPDTYTVIALRPPARRYAGRVLNQRFIDDPLRPPDALLRWHFRQAVLTKMKASGEPTFEWDIKPGEDILGRIRDGPRAAERMEFELFGRLAAQMDIVSTSEDAKVH